MENNKKRDNEENLKVRSSEPLDKTLRFVLPKKSLRIKAAARETLELLTVDFLTPKEIAQRRKTTIRAVQKVIKRLKQKGLISFDANLYGSTRPLSEPLGQRLHGQEWNIKIISKSQKYEQSRKKGNTLTIEGNTIRLYRDSLEIYSGQSFFQENEQRATAESLTYWMRFFRRLEQEFNIILIKPRVRNLSLVNQHYGETNSEMAKDYLKRKEKFQIYAEDDSKLWFTIDNSFNLKERECLHPETAKQDSEKVTKQINDWRAHDPPTNSELTRNIQQVTENQLMFAKNIETHIAAIQELARGVKELREEVKKLNGNS